MKQIILDDAVTYLRELMAMDKETLLREANFANSRRAGEKVKRPDMVLFAFERKFNAKVTDPTLVTKTGIPFNAR